MNKWKQSCSNLAKLKPFIFLFWRKDGIEYKH